MKHFAGLCALLGALWLVGCGGGGGGNSVVSGGSGRVAVLLTDSFREDYAHVWATIYHVALIPQTGSPVALFDDTSGHQIDLKTLRDATGERFSFLGSASVPEGTYTGIAVTVGTTMQLFRNGVAVGDPVAVDSSLPTDTSGRPILTLTFATAKTLGSSTTNLVIDFDLARFIVRNSKVLPALKEGTGLGLHDFARHNQGEYRGTVSALTGTAPDLTFTLTRKDGTTVSVTTSASTALYGDGTLANGATVELRGTLDTTTQTLAATHLEVEGTGGTRPPRVFGTASDLNAASGTFTVTVTRACMLTPTQTTVSVVTNSTTVFRGDDGSTLTQAAFFTALATTATVDVEGTFDSASNTLTATAAKIVDKTQDGGWERGTNRFRRGADRSNWGHDVFRH